MTGRAIRTGWHVLLVLSLVGLAACSSDGGTSLDPSLPIPIATAASVATTATAVPVTVAPVTTTTTPAIDLVLHGTSIGGLQFGAPADLSVAAVSIQLGPATSDQVLQLPVVDGDLHETADLATGFVAAVGRRVCWNALCLSFAGVDAVTMTLAGWRYGIDVLGTPVTPVLADASGVTLGSRWSDFPAVISVQPGGCPATGAGATTDGIVLDVRGGQFSATDANGEYQELLPDPTEVMVTAMTAGDVIFALDADC